MSTAWPGGVCSRHRPPVEDKEEIWGEAGRSGIGKRERDTGRMGLKRGRRESRSHCSGRELGQKEQEKETIKCTYFRQRIETHATLALFPHDSASTNGSQNTNSKAAWRGVAEREVRGSSAANHLSALTVPHSSHSLWAWDLTPIQWWWYLLPNKQSDWLCPTFERLSALIRWVWSKIMVDQSRNVKNTPWDLYIPWSPACPACSSATARLSSQPSPAQPSPWPSLTRLHWALRNSVCGLWPRGHK